MAKYLRIVNYVSGIYPHHSPQPWFSSGTVMAWQKYHRIEAWELEAGDDWYLKGYDEELWDGRMPEWGGVKESSDWEYTVCPIWGYDDGLLTKIPFYLVDIWLTNNTCHIFIIYKWNFLQIYEKFHL